MRLIRHVLTLATIIRAGDETTLVSLEDWYRGQILAPAPTRLIQTATGRPRRDLAGTKLWVMARLTAACAEELDLREWQPCGRAQAA